MSLNKNLEFEKTSFLNKSNSTFIEEMYVRYINKDPELPKSWKEYFDDLGEEIEVIANEIKGPSWNPLKKIKIKDISENIQEKNNGYSEKNNGALFGSDEIIKSNTDSIRAVALIRAYRQRGHLLAKLDPLGMMKTEYLDELHPEHYGFKGNDYKKEIYLDGVINKKKSNVREILDFLNKVYCGPVGYEYMHITNPEERKWLRDRIELDDNALEFTENGKEAILNKLIQAEGFEKFLHTKYVGTKRFGLDGGESLIPALEQIIKIGGQSNVFRG